MSKTTTQIALEHIDAYGHACVDTPIHVEAHEALAHGLETYSGDMATFLCDALYEDAGDLSAKLSGLLAKAMADISADDLCALRDLLRAAMIDETRRMVRREVATRWTMGEFSRAAEAAEGRRYAMAQA